MLFGGHGHYRFHHHGRCHGPAAEWPSAGPALESAGPALESAGPALESAASAVKSTAPAAREPAAPAVLLLLPVLALAVGHIPAQ
jgi:hypothetical protein